jgi:WD40 repeat protein
MSALTFTPPKSLIYKAYFDKSPQKLPTVLNQPRPHQFTHRTLGDDWSWGHEVGACEFSPDGQRLLMRTRANGTFFWLWGTSTGTIIRQLREYENGVSSAAFSSDGVLIASGGRREPLVLLWDGHTGVLLRKLPRFHDQAINNVVFALNDDIVVSSSKDCTILRWSTSMQNTMGIPPREQFENPAQFEAPTGLISSPGGKLVVAWYPCGIITIWDPKSLTPLRSRKEDNKLSAVIFSYDGTKLIGAVGKGKIHIWDVEADVTLQVLDARAEKIYQLAVCADRTTLASTDGEIIRLWNIHNGKELSSPLTIATGKIPRVLAFSKQGRRLVSGTENGAVQVWNLWQNGSSISCEGISLLGHTDRVTLVSVSPDGNKIASHADDSTLRLWDIRDDINFGGQISVLEQVTIEHIVYSQSGKVVLCSSSEGSLSIYDANKGEIIGSKIAYKDNKVTSIQFSHHDDTFAAGYHNGVVKIWRISGNAQDSTSFDLTGHQSAIIDVEFSCKGILFASSSRDNSIIIWAINFDKMIGTSVQKIDTAPLLSGLFFSPDEKYLAYKTDEAKLQLYCLETKQVTSTPLENRYVRNDISFSPDGKTLMRSDYGGADVYDLHPGNELFRFAMVTDRIKYRATFTEDGEYIYADDRFRRITSLSRTTFTEISLVNRVGPGDQSPLPPFIYDDDTTSIVRLRDDIYKEPLAGFALPTDLKVRQWTVHANQLALGLHDGTVMFVRVPYEFM